MAITRDSQICGFDLRVKDGAPWQMAKVHIAGGVNARSRA